MEHQNNPNNNNNNQDVGGDKKGKRPVPANLDEPSRLPKTSRCLPTDELAYDIIKQLRLNFPQNQQLTSNFTQTNPLSSDNLLHSLGSSSNVSQPVFRIRSQIPSSEANACGIKISENTSNNHLGESSSTQWKKPEKGPNTRPCKSCNCKKTKCLNLYCECFARKKYCVNCKCQNCENISGNEHAVNVAQKEVLEHNPTAFDPKVIEEQHTKGCACKNSNCEKGYCDCKAHNVRCTSKCRCTNCKNPIGARVSGEVNTQAEQDNISANVPRQPPVQVPIQYQINQSIGNSESQQMYQASWRAKLETSRASQPPHFPHATTSQASTSYHPSTNDELAYAICMQGLQGDSYNSRGALIMNGRNGTYHANETLNTQQLTPSAENLLNCLTGSSNNNNGNNNNNNNNSNIGWSSSSQSTGHNLD